MKKMGKIIDYFLPAIIFQKYVQIHEWRVDI